MANNYPQLIASLLEETITKDASDLHLHPGKPPMLRVDGHLTPVPNHEALSPASIEGLVMALLAPEQKERFLEQKQLDFAYGYQDRGRFRINAFYQQGSIAAALRLIPTKIRSVEELELPPILHDFTKLAQGFILAVGPTGHGKSTTLAALLDEINHSRDEHIITIEDPIEYLFEQDRCVIAQREVGQDTSNFNAGLRSVLRQDPDVIMIGEMRDPESIATALTAAETGHLVFSTLHTNSASQTIDRIIDSFPPEQQSQIAAQLASTLVATISKRLIPRKDGPGRVAATEIMVVDSAIRNLIRERKIYQVDIVLETGAQKGMVTLNRSLADLVRRGIISVEQAMFHSTDPKGLERMIGRTK